MQKVLDNEDSFKKEKEGQKTLGLKRDFPAKSNSFE